MASNTTTARILIDPVLSYRVLSFPVPSDHVPPQHALHDSVLPNLKVDMKLTRFLDFVALPSYSSYLVLKPEYRFNR